MKEKNRLKKITYSAIFICLLGVLSFLWTEKKQEQILTQSREENILSIFVDGEKVSAIPKKDSGYTLDTEKSTCTNGVTLSFDYNTWSVKANYTNYQNTSNSRVKCNLYFKKRTFAEAVVDCGALGKDAGTCIKENNHLTTEVVSDETVDNNLRFIGADPNNYVWFNEELWRIIGVMNNIDDGTGKKETRLKIIRDESIGGYSWDFNSDGTYDNDWSTSSLMNLLNNEAYYNRTTGMYYNNSTTASVVNFSDTGLTEEAKQMISNVVWNLGGSSTYTDVTTKMFYERERKTDVYNGRPTTWKGQVGLMYSSDYGFATAGGTTTNRNECLNEELFNWIELSDCYNNNWLYDNSNSQWTLTPFSIYPGHAFYVRGLGGVSTFDGSSANVVSPAVYLVKNIKITAGDGTKENPYQLSL